MKYAFNGRFLTKKMTGQERYAFELISHLDKICEKGEYCPDWATEARGMGAILPGTLSEETSPEVCQPDYDICLWAL